jgi:outer membrane lipoprotein-sorting protein
MRIFIAILVTLSLVPLLAAQEHPLEHVLARMDENSRAFRSLEASIKRIDTNALTNKPVETSGKVYIAKAVDSSLRMKLELTEPKSRAQSALFDKGVGQVYEHTPNLVSEKKLEDSSVVELAMMGFGVPSERIKKSYAIKLAGQETIDGKTTSVLELTALQKDSDFPRIKMWINQQDWNAVQVELTGSNRNRNLFKYSNVKRNQSIPNNIFRLNLPSNVKKAG